MMETITIPSPSAFLSSPVTQSAKLPPQPTSKRKSTSTKSSSSTSKKQAGVAKPKQSKSRNGCITCKAKRLKCDETKPSCAQCHKRNVTCGGYKKDFKWRPFEEATFTNKVVPPRSKRNSISHAKPPDPGAGSPSPSDGSSYQSPDGDAEMSLQDTFFNAAAPSPMMQMQDTPLSNSQFHTSIPFDMSTPPYLRNAPRRSFEPNSVTSPLDSLFDDNSFVPPPNRSSMSGQSPRLIDLLLPGSPLNAPASTHSLDQGLPMQPPHPQFLYQPGPTNHGLIIDDDGVEEIIRQSPSSDEMWHSFSPTVSVQLASRSPSTAPTTPFPPLYQQPSVQAGSPEMLMLRFDKQTCGILSVKDGPTENPWRTLIWPLARDSPALYHAIASMTAFHTSREKPALRVDGMEHMRRSIRALASGIEGMRTDTALATTLVLAFSESWDQHISTGIEHLRGARILVNQAISRHSRRPLSGDDLARLKFLANTWVYMDVIARLTSVDDFESTDFSTMLSPLFGPHGFSSHPLLNNRGPEIDPLMGCASSLFPLIGRAATLCRKVRAADTNSIAIISQAIELKEAILAWSPGPTSDFEDPEDPSSEISHALQTAEAYRYATLLYLHQAVPEIPSLPSEVLAKKVLVFLATVPLSSRLVIVQIYPLLAAGCEVVEQSDREWVRGRWESMERRMWIGNLEKCWVVTQEVWNRRDAYEEEKVKERESLRERRGTAAGMGAAAMMREESGKRRFEDEEQGLGLGEEFLTFEEMLNGNTLSSNPGHPPRPKRQRPVEAVDKGKGKKVGGGNNEMVVDEMEREFTVRGKLHWVGVMKDWEWEILLG